MAMNLIIEQIIDMLENVNAKNILNLPFAFRQHYDEELTGIFSYNETNDPQQAIEDVEFNFTPEYICYPLIDMHLENNALIFNCCDPIASSKRFSQYRQNELMSANDVLDTLRSSPAYQDANDIIVNVGTAYNKKEFGSHRLIRFNGENDIIDVFDVVKRPMSHIDKIVTSFKICSVGDVEFDGDFDFYHMPWSSMMAMLGYVNQLNDMELINNLANRFQLNENDKHDYIIRYLTNQLIGEVNQVKLNSTSCTLDEIIPEYLVGINKDDYPIEIVEIIVDGKKLNKTEIAKWNERLNDNINECDGGAAGGDAGAAIAANAGDIAGEMNGITTAEVLGTNEPGKGFFGKDNFYIPSKIAHPLYRWEIANGGSKRKKDKNGKPKKYAYEKGMKVVVDMFEAENAAPQIDKRKINRKLHAISKTIKNMSDVENIAANYIKNKDKIANKFSDDRFKQIKQLFIDFGNFLLDVIRGKWNASWFTISMVAVALAYLFMPVDLIPDPLPVPFPGVGFVDDAFVLGLVYAAIKDEFEEWRKAQ